MQPSAADYHVNHTPTKDSTAINRSHGASLLFRDLSYKVSTPTGERVILDSVTGLVQPGQFCAILGGSGSGKTSLLDILSGQNRDTAAIGGTVMLDGEVMAPKQLQERVGYVMQDDRLLPNLTVRETLLFSAHLRLGGCMSWSEREERVDQIIGTLGLRNVARSKAGGTFRRGLSGGEKRRVTIGLQLLGDPSVLFLDEPTTGLDSFTANSIVSALQKLAADGKTVVFTIHQPRSDIFHLLDMVLLLSEGRSLYFGSASNVISHFSSLGYPCDEYANPLDFYGTQPALASVMCLALTLVCAVDLIGVDRRTAARGIETMQRTTALAKSYEVSSTRLELEGSIENNLRTPSHSSLDTTTHSNLLLVSWTLFTRMLQNLLRDPVALASRVVQFSLFSILFIAFVIEFGDDQQSVQNRTGFLYQILSVSLFLGMMQAMSFCTTFHVWVPFADLSFP